jgi:hypothetical protein
MMRSDQTQTLATERKGTCDKCYVEETAASLQGHRVKGKELGAAPGFWLE